MKKFVIRFCESLGRWSRDDRGSMAIITAISLTVLVAFAGLGVDVALWMRAKNNVQGAA